VKKASVDHTAYSNINIIFTHWQGYGFFGEFSLHWSPGLAVGYAKTGIPLACTALCIANNADAL